MTIPAGAPIEPPAPFGRRADGGSAMPEPVAHLAAVALRPRAHRPLIHYIPNAVTAGDVADALLAAGAAPIMAVAAEEVADIHADALALNMGTPTAGRLAALAVAGRAAAARGCPIILDPVGAGATPFRRAAARQMLAELPIAALRLNAGEASVLLDGIGGRGVDAPDGPVDTAALAVAVARRYGGVAAVTGPTDAVSDGERTLLIDNGHPLLARITGAGCMATGLVAACAAVEADRLLAAAAALLLFGVAGELAAREAVGPGTFRGALLDALYRCDERSLVAMGEARWA